MTIDPVSLFMGWKAGQMIAQQRNNLRIMGSDAWLNWAFDTTDLKLTITDNTPDDTTNTLNTIFSGQTLTIGTINADPTPEPDPVDPTPTPDSGNDELGGEELPPVSGSGENELPITPIDPPESGEEDWETDEF